MCLSALAVISLAACHSATPEANPLAGRWYLSVPTGTEPVLLTIEGSIVTMAQDGMDGFEVTATNAIQNGNVISFTDNENSQCTVTYNPVDSSITLSAVNPESGAGINFKSNYNQKLNGVRIESYQPLNLEVYSDRELTQKISEIAPSIVVPYLDVDSALWTILTPEGKVGYAKRESTMYDYADIPDQYFNKSFVNTDGDYDISYSFEKPNEGMIAVCKNLLPHDGGNAHEEYFLGKVDGNGIALLYSGSYDDVTAYNTSALNKLDNPIDLRFISFYGSPVLVIDNQNYNEQTF